MWEGGAAAGSQAGAAESLLAAAELPVQQLLRDLAPDASGGAEVAAAARTYPLQLEASPGAAAAYGCAADELGHVLGAKALIKVRVTYTVSRAAA
jgi:hypothetical protein